MWLWLIAQARHLLVLDTLRNGRPGAGNAGHIGR